MKLTLIILTVGVSTMLIISQVEFAFYLMNQKSDIENLASLLPLATIPLVVIGTKKVLNKIYKHKKKQQ